MDSINGNITGDKLLMAALNTLPEMMRQTVYVATMKEGVKPVLKKARKNIRQVRDSGAHERSLKSKVVSYKKGGTVYGVIGHDFNHTETVHQRGVKKARFVRPAKTAHLIELGTSTQPARPYMRPAMETEKDAVMTAFATGIDKGLSKISAKLNKSL